MGYEIWGKYGDVWEFIDWGETTRDRDYLLMEYRLSFGPEWNWSVRRGNG